MKIEIAQQLHRLFDPDKALGVADQEHHVSRSGSVANAFRRELRYSSGHRFILVGAAGSGKSSELARLYHTMQSDTQRVTISFDLSRQFWVEQLSAGQALFLITLAILRAASQGDAPGDQTVHHLHDHLARAYMAIVDGVDTLDADTITGLIRNIAVVAPGQKPGRKTDRKTDRQSPTGDAGRPDAPAPRFVLPGRGKFLAPGDPGTQVLHRTLRDVLLAVRQTFHHRPLLVLVDGLDEVHDDRRLGELFTPGVLSAPCVDDIDLVFTAPPSLDPHAGLESHRHVRREFRALRLGLFNIVRRDGSRDHDEIEAMRSLLDKRVNAAGLRSNAVWPGGDLRHPAIDRIIEQSGGIPRDLVRLVRRAIVRSDPNQKRLQVADLEASTRERAKQYLLRVDLDTERLLLDTWQSQQRPGDPVIHDLLESNLILSYDNGRAWFLPHPMVMPVLRERFPAEFERLAGMGYGRKQSTY